MEGRWLEPNEIGVVVISQTGLTDDLPTIRIGDTVELSVNGRFISWQVVGIAESVGVIVAASL